MADMKPIMLTQQGDMPMDLGMEYEILLLQLGSLSRKFYYAEEVYKLQQEQLDVAIQRLENKTLDLERLQKESFSTALLKLMGTFERIFNKESEEIIRAKLEFDKIYALKISSQRRLLELEGEIQEKKHRLRNIKEVLLRRNPDLGSVLSEKEKESAKIQYEYMQTAEAENACYHLLESISDILTSLDASETIIRWDLINEIDFLLKYVNRSQLDAAEAMILEMERKIQTLERELQDLNYIYEEQYQVLSSARPAIDEFFTTVFSEWSTKDIVEKNIQQLKVLEDTVFQIMELLTHRKRELEEVYLKLN